MRFIKRLFTSYAIDFWIFLILITGLTAAACNMSQMEKLPEGRTYLLVFASMTVLSAFLIEPNRKYNLSPLSWLSSKAGERFSGSFSMVQLNNYQSHMLILAALAFVFTVRTVIRFLLGEPSHILTVYVLFLSLIFLSLVIGLIKSFSERYSMVIICLSMAFPIILDIILSGASPEHTSNSYVWIIISVVFSIFLKDQRAPSVFFKLFICTLILGLISEMYFIGNIDVTESLELIFNIFSTGFVIFAALELYAAHSSKNYSVLEDIYKELQDTQSQLVQREQMVTLGQLIAGVAHEINTPIGAIKSSAETLSYFDMGKLLVDMRRYSDDDMDAILVILDLCSNSVKNMRSTMEIRRGKAQMRKYMESIDIKDADIISGLLSGMDVCDIEKIADNMDIFRRENIVPLLQAVRVLFTYISSVQNIRYASDKVAKIVFALKSFSHMNMTGEECAFDVVKNIDNILVLYQNQLKRGVEIIKKYDENVPYIYGNVEEIGQVWTNIAQNAIHAMSYVGKLTIAVRDLGDTVEVSFSDTGTGIAPDNLNKIFAPFFTTKPLGEGSGLGLDICRKIITKHNGDIKVTSKYGHGTTFIVTLPVKRELGMKGL